MAETTLPFWLASARLDSIASLLEWLKSVHIQPRWLDEIMFVSDSLSLEFDGLSGCDDSLLVSKYTGWQKSRQPLLHDACRKIAVGDARLILAVSVIGGNATAAVLCAPSVVGMYNLLPQAYLETRLAFHIPSKEEALLEILQVRLKKAERAVNELDLMSIHIKAIKRPVKTDTPFSGATWLKQEPGMDGEIFSSCHDMVTALTASKKKHGLVVDVDDALDLRAVWLEAV